MPAKRYKDTRTGGYVYLDDDNNEVPKEKLTQLDLEPRTGLDTAIHDYGGKYVPDILTGIGGIAGSAIGTPFLGGLAGAGIGSAVGKGLKAMNPQWFGENTENSASEMVGDIAQDAVIDKGVGLAAKGASYLIPSSAKNALQKGIKWAFPSKVDPATTAALANDPNFAFTTGQVNPAAKFLEDKFAPGAKEAIINKQNLEIVKEIAPNLKNPEKIIRAASREVKAQGISKTQKGTYRKGTAGLTKKLHEVGTPKNPNVTLTQIGEEITSDPQKMRLLAKQSQSNEFGKALVKNDLVETAMNNADGVFDPKVARQFIRNNKNVVAEAMDKTEAASFEEFLKKAEVIGDAPTVKNAALRMGAGTAGATLALGGVTYYVGSDPKKAAMAGGMVLLGKFGVKQFAEKVLMNPKNAQIAAGLLNVDPLTTKAKVGTQAILAAMKGMQVVFKSPDGVEHQAEITNGAKVKLLD